MLNKVILMGRLVDTPELKTTPANVSVCTVRIAVDRDYTDKDGNRPCDFITVVFWRQTAEFVCKYFNKGSMIALVGQVQTRSYKTKEGATRYTTEIVAESASFTGERRDNSNKQAQTQGYYAQQTEQAPPPQNAQTQQAPAPQVQEYGDEQTFFSDDLPF